MGVICPYEMSVETFSRLTNSTELSRSQEAASCAATQGLPNILWYLKVHHCVHKRLPQVILLSQINGVHITPSYLCRVHLNTVHPSASCSS
jgi:hypothetical protein